MDVPPGTPPGLLERYGPQHLSLFTDAELERFLPGLGPRDARRPASWDDVAPRLGWELLYRAEPALYDRLVAGERLHPGIVAWLPESVPRALEAAAGTGRLTLGLAPRCGKLVATEPAAGMRELLEAKLARAGITNVDVRDGYFDDLPVPDGWAQLAITCSAFTADDAHGGEAGLAGLERTVAPGGLVVIVRPPGPEWFAARGYAYERFEGNPFVEFSSPQEAAELAAIFYPHAEAEIRRRGDARVPYDLLGDAPPNDFCWKRL